MSKIVLISGVFLLSFSAFAKDSTYDPLSYILHIPRVVTDDRSAAYSNVELQLKGDDTWEIVKIDNAETNLTGNWLGRIVDTVGHALIVKTNTVRLSLVEDRYYGIYKEGLYTGSGIITATDCRGGSDLECAFINEWTKGYEFTVQSKLSEDNRVVTMTLITDKAEHIFNGEISNDFRHFLGYGVYRSHLTIQRTD